MPKTIQLLACDKHSFDAYFCEAEGDPKGCILILHEIFGLTDFIKELCEFWAKEGYHTLAPALYDRLRKDIAIPYDDQGYQKALETKQALLSLHNVSGVTGYDLPLLDIDAAKNYLADTFQLPVTILGLSFGGTLGWLAACRLNQIAAVSAYYGTHIYQFIQEKPRCPVILQCAEYDDLLTRDQVKEISAYHPEVEVCLYPTTHGFRCSHMRDFGGQRFDAHATVAADEKTRQFFDDHFICDEKRPQATC